MQILRKMALLGEHFVPHDVLRVQMGKAAGLLDAFSRFRSLLWIEFRRRCGRLSLELPTIPVGTLRHPETLGPRNHSEVVVAAADRRKHCVENGEPTLLTVISADLGQGKLTASSSASSRAIRCVLSARWRHSRALKSRTAYQPPQDSHSDTARLVPS